LTGCGAARTIFGAVWLIAIQMKLTLRETNIIPTTYLARRKLRLALRNATTEPARPISQIMKPEANGNATRWQGYVARDGFGITLMRNHISAANPVIEGSQNSQRFFACPAALGQHGGIRFFSEKNVITPVPYQIRLQ